VDYPDHPIRIEGWDPARAQMDFEVGMVQALYSPLLELDDQAQLKPGWAESFTWQDTHTLLLKIRREHKRADGTDLTAADALHSLKRLAFLQQDQDAFYVEQFCHRKRLSTIHDSCSGLSAQDQVLTIQTRDRVAILPQLLTAVETSIVPLAALEADGLSIRDHAVGSGPYSLERQTSAPILFRANPYHFNFNRDMPQQIHLIASRGNTLDDFHRAFLEKRLDHMTRFSALNAFKFKDLASRLGDEVQQQSTLPMGVGVLLFTNEGLRRHDERDRRSLVLLLQKASRRCLLRSGQDQVRRPTLLLIPATAVGSLNTKEATALEAMRQSHALRPIPQSVRIRFPESMGDELVPCLADELKGWPVVFNQSGDEEADLRFKGYDLSTYEELGTLRSMLTIGLLDADGADRESWIYRYMAEQDTGRRMQFIKQAQLRAIWGSPSVIPLWNYETGALIRRPWLMNFSPLSMTNPFHLIRYAG
jgi:hypothetical protein